jgi:hypothetical protein
MNRMYRWSALISVALLAPARAENQPKAEKPASPWLIDRTLTVSPQPAPTPALKYLLLPPSWDLKEGNAVPIYLRLVHEQSDAARKYWSETPRAWNELPIDKIPLEEARKFLDAHKRFLRQFELGTRRRIAEWNYTLDEGDPISILLPDAQVMRNYEPMLNLQIRVALADGDFAKAVHHLQTGFAFSRHISEGPFFISTLVGLALANRFLATTADCIEQPDAPNLYWALTDLPHPMIDLKRGQDTEYRMLEMWFPELEDLNRERTAAQWDALLRKIRTEVHRVLQDNESHKLPNWFPKNCEADDPASKSPDLPAARRYVARTLKLSAEQAEAMPAAQAILLYFVAIYAEHRDDVFKSFSLPYAESRRFAEAADKRLRKEPATEGQVVARELLPAVAKIRWAVTRFDRNVAALRTIEAVRLYAAAHDGKLPDKLADVNEVVVPNDPATGQAFAYTRDGDIATITGRVADESIPTNGIRYRVTIRKK